MPDLLIRKLPDVLYRRLQERRMPVAVARPGRRVAFSRTLSWLTPSRRPWMR